MGSQLPLLVVPERSLQKGAEDLGLDLAPIESRCVAKEFELVHLKMEARRLLEQPAVRVGDAFVLSLARTLGRWVVEQLEQASQLIGARPLRVGDEVLDEPLEPMPGYLYKILREHRPDALEDEIAALVRTTASSLGQTPVQLRHQVVRATRDGRVPVDEDGVLARQEQQRVITIGKLDEVERRAWSTRI